MKVLAAVIVPPHLTASGGARAGELLSGALSHRCDITMANMLSGVGESAGMAKRVEVSTWVPFYLASQRIPRRYKSLLYRSNIPRIIDLGNMISFISTILCLPSRWSGSPGHVARWQFPSSFRPTASTRLSTG